MIKLKMIIKSTMTMDVSIINKEKSEFNALTHLLMFNFMEWESNFGNNIYAGMPDSQWFETSNGNFI